MAETFPIAFGRYQLVERLAVGGMAELFKAQVSGAHGFTKTVVIKRILPHLAADEHFNTMFIDEAKITARLSHPKIAQTLELGKFNGQLYIAMEYVDGLDVLAMLRECAHRRTRIPLPQAVFMTMEVLDALDFAHQQTDAEGKALNIVHRDISPSNILLARRGDVKLVDFGIAQADARGQQTQSGTLKGKYGYMAPEQVIGGAVDSRSDLFSAAIVLAEMAMGRRLFVSPNELDVLLMVRDVKLDRLAKYGAELDPALDRIMRKALSKAPGSRFQTGSEFRDALGEWLFQKHHRVTGRDLAGLVSDLYDDAWQRKRMQAPAPLPPPPVAEVARKSASALVAGNIESGPTDPSGQPAEFPTSASMEEAIALVAGEQQGIPIGELRPMDSAPVVLIEHSEKPPPPKPSDEIVALEGLDIDLSDLDLELDVSSKSGEYNLGELGEELGEPKKLPRQSQADAGDESDPDYTTQEIAFDDIVAAVENVVPRDGTGKLIAPSEDEIKRARSAKPKLSTIRDEPDDAGELAATPPLRVLCRLAVARATGLLVVSIGGIRKEIYIVDGRPEFVSSNVASELFGEYLVSQKVISEGELSMALAMMPHYGGKLGDTLVGLGLMKPLDVFRHLTQQVRDKLIDVCTWAKGQFAWFDSRRNEREAFPLDLDCFEVLGAGALAIPFDHVEDWIRGHGNSALTATKNQDLQPEHFRIGSAARDAYNKLDGRRTINQLLEQYTDKQQRQRFARVTYLLAMTELAR